MEDEFDDVQSEVYAAQLGFLDLTEDDEIHEDSQVDDGEEGGEERMGKAWLDRKYFPSKCGGRPAWLIPEALPSPESLTCGVCAAPLCFLTQVYAPMAEQEAAFHRTLFVFCCRKGSCIKQAPHLAARAWRAQLPRQNAFYDYDPAPVPDEDKVDVLEEVAELSEGVRLCVVCGLPGPKKCSRCKRASYCSKAHQKLHWKQGGHGKLCGEEDGVVLPDAGEEWLKDVVLPQHRLVIEGEYFEDEEMDEDDGMTDEQRADAGDKYGLEEADEEAFREGERSGLVDKTLLYFQERVAATSSEQVIRYGRRGLKQPLWVADKGKPSDDDIPNCDKCGGRRVFEFQVLPQLLYYLKVDDTQKSYHEVLTGDSMDFGVLAVYTCEASCGDASSGYLPEFIWHQEVGADVKTSRITAPPADAVLDDDEDDDDDEHEQQDNAAHLDDGD